MAEEVTEAIAEVMVTRVEDTEAGAEITGTIAEVSETSQRVRGTEGIMKEEKITEDELLVENDDK